MFEGRVLSAVPEGVLVFVPVLREHAGAYTCTATNAAGTVSALVYLEVQCELTCVQPVGYTYMGGGGS